MGPVVPDLEVGGRGDCRHFCCLVRVLLNLNAAIEWGGVARGGGVLWLSGEARVQSRKGSDPDALPACAERTSEAV